LHRIEKKNKGFGSFSVIKIDNKEITFDENRLLRYYPKIYKINSTDPLKKILEDYQYLKSGTNRPYKKSLLFEYMCKKSVRWEKRMIKEYLKKDFPSIFKKLKYEKEPIECKNEKSFEYQYIRGLLGITEQIEFLKRDARDFRDKIKIQIKSKDKSVERFKSPITYKVINNNIYVLAVNEIPIKGKEFIFKLKGEQKKLYKPIKIPQDFDIFKFLDFALTNRLSYTILKS